MKTLHRKHQLAARLAAFTEQAPASECGHGTRSVVTCGKCRRAWCEQCDPAPSALCHYCHGRGYSTAPRKEAK